MVRMVGIEVVGQYGAVRRIDRMQIGRTPHRLGKSRRQNHTIVIDENRLAVFGQFEPRLPDVPESQRRWVGINRIAYQRWDDGRHGNGQ